MITWYYPFNKYYKSKKNFPSYPGVPVIPPLPEDFPFPNHMPKERQCGECGILIPDGSWGYSCPNGRCPVQPKVWF
jgi:hypothetical protein